MSRFTFAPIVALIAGILSSACTAPADSQDIALAEDVTDREDGVTGSATCDASRAHDAVPWKQAVFLDVIAYAEGTKGRGKDGYNVAFGYRYFNSCDKHPNASYCSRGLCSTAAGRYQFIYKTWKGLGYSTFRPENQEKGAMKLIGRRGVTIPTSRALSSTEFANALSRLSYEWASLPPGRYGQPSYSTSALRKVYCNGGAGC